MIAAVRHVSGADVQFWLGLAIVVACLICAAVVLYRARDWLIAGGLVLVALFAAVLLL